MTDDIIRYEHVVFLQGQDDYNEFEKIMYPDMHGVSLGWRKNEDGALEYLKQWDYGEETMEEPKFEKYEAIGIHDEEYETDDYLMSWYPQLSYAGLLRKTFVANGHQFDTFVAGYVECMLWANTYREDPELEPFDAYHEGYRLDTDSDVYETLKDDCIDFIRENFETLQRVMVKHFPDMDDWDQHGHDFALTRNGHGAGFWDRDYGTDGDTLTEASKPYGSRSLALNADDEFEIFE